MRKLHVEELERREMLNGASFCPPPAPGPASLPPARAMERPAERAPALDCGDPRGAPAEAFRPGSNPAPAVVVVTAAEPIVLVSAARPDVRGPVSSTRPGSDLAAFDRPAEAETGETHAAAMPAPAPPPAKAADVIFTSLETPIVVPGWHGDSSPPSLAGSMLPGETRAGAAPGEAPSVVPVPPPAPAASPPAEPRPASWPLPLSDVLGVLRPLDAVALELGMQRFVAQLEAIGAGVPHWAGGEWRLWLAAGAAAALACELARRQLRRGTPEVAIDALGTDDGPDGGPFPLPRSRS